MALTLSDLDIIIYARWRSQGINHEEAIKNVPEHYRQDFINNIEKSATESHFGMKNKWFYITLISVVVAMGLFLLLVCV